MTDLFEQTLANLVSYRERRAAAEGLALSTMSESDADKLLCDLLSHAQEELFELRICLNRKSWKPMPSLRGSSDQSLELRQLALEELSDVLLMLDAFRYVAGFSLDEVLISLNAKMHKNMTRIDHTCNN